MAELRQIGYHLVDNVYSAAQASEHFALIADTKPACINVLGGSQYREALSFAIRAKERFPEMRVIFRHYRDAGDDGMEQRISARDWWERIGSLYINMGLTVLCSNESMSADLRTYANWQAEIMRYAGDKGVGIAFNRFATHNPPLAQIPQLDATFRASIEYPFGLHTHSPNVYYADDNLDGFKYPGYAIQRAQAIGCRIDVTIGEFAWLRDIRDAYNGYRSINWWGGSYALDLIARAREYLPGIPVCVYSLGEWPIGRDSFSLDEDALDVIQYNPIPITKGNPMPIPETDPRWLANPQMHLRSASASKVNVRSEPNTKAAIVTSLQPAIEYTVGYIPYGKLTAAEIAQMTDGYVWHSIKVDQLTGWIRQDVVLLTEIPAPPPEDSEEEAARKYRLELYSMIDYDLSQAFSKLAILKSVDERLNEKPPE